MVLPAGLLIHTSVGNGGDYDRNISIAQIYPIARKIFSVGLSIPSPGETPIVPAPPSCPLTPRRNGVLPISAGPKLDLYLSDLPRAPSAPHPQGGAPF